MESFASLLHRYGCTLHGRVSQYDYERYNLLTNQAQTALKEDGHCEVRLLDSVWQLSLKVQRGDDLPDCADLAVTFRCVSGKLPQAALAVDLAVGEWSAGNYVLMPSVAYNGNRFLSRRIPYSPKLYYVQDIGTDVPMIITDVPRLAIEDGPSRIQERSGSMAVPSVGFYSSAKKQGVLVLTAQGNALGDYGVGLEENRDRLRAVVSVTAPVMRELHSYRGCDSQRPSLDKPHDFAAGDEVTISLRICVFGADSAQALFDRFAQERKSLVSQNAPRNTLPYSACFELQQEKFNRENFVPEHGYYSIGPRNMFLQDWQIGWTGGMISTYPLLFSGDKTTRQNVLRNFDWLFPNGISPSGFFWDSGRNGTEWIGGDIRKPHTANWHLIRKSGDGVYYIVKQFLLMEKLGIEVKPAWREGTSTVCGALVKLWRKNGQFGQFVDSISGEIKVGGSTSGAIIPAALVLAASYFKRDEYLMVAIESGEHYYNTFTSKGMSCGGPGDALQNPDSESWYALIESYMALYEATGDAIWLQRAAETSRQFATWVVAYDFKFPPVSTFGKAGIRSTGAVYANTQNKHAAPGLCTYSGLGLLKLFRATGDRFHLDMLFDIAHNIPQYLPHPQNPLGLAVFGRMCERVNLTDWEGKERIGETNLMTTWAETSLMLTTIEIPGLYVQPDKALAVAFDNIEAEVIADSATSVAVRIYNPTALVASVLILAESRSEAIKPLAENVLLNATRERLAAGEERVLKFAKDRRGR
jgi:hypothetical protein